MRTGVVVAAAIAVAVIVCGFLAVNLAETSTAPMLAAAYEVRTLIEMGEWQRAEITLDAYTEGWMKQVNRLEMVIDHEWIDTVTDALHSARTGVRLRDEAICAEALSSLEDSAQRLVQRERFTLSNLL